MGIEDEDHYADWKASLVLINKLREKLDGAEGQALLDVLIAKLGADSSRLQAELAHERNTGKIARQERDAYLEALVKDPKHSQPSYGYTGLPGAHVMKRLRKLSAFVESDPVSLDWFEIVVVLTPKERELIALGNMISAIKDVRERCNIGLKESKEICDAYRDKLDNEAGEDKPIEPEVQPSSKPSPESPYSVILKNAGPSKIATIKVIRLVTNLGLKEAKDMACGNLPIKVCKAPTLEVAEQIVEHFKKVGALAVIHG